MRYEVHQPNASGMIDNDHNLICSKLEIQCYSTSTASLPEDGKRERKIKQIICGVYFWVHTTVVLIIPRIGGTKEEKIGKGERNYCMCSVTYYSTTATTSDGGATPGPAVGRPNNVNFSSHRARVASLTASLAFARSFSALEGVRHNTSSVLET
jgi:hypothetical protein